MCDIKRKCMLQCYIILCERKNVNGKIEESMYMP